MALTRKAAGMLVQTDIKPIPALSFRELDAYVSASGSGIRRWAFSPSAMEAFRFRVLVEAADAGDLDSGSGEMRCRDGGRVQCGWRGSRGRRLHWALWHHLPGLRAHLVLRETSGGTEGSLSLQHTSPAMGMPRNWPDGVHKDARRLLMGISPPSAGTAT